LADEPYEPAGHGAVQAADVRPGAEPYEPAGHGVQVEVLPVPRSEYVPGEHVPEQAADVLPPMPYVPAGQGVHADDVAEPAE